MSWFVGTLRERYSSFPAGTVVALRRSNMKLAAGPCWWVRPQGTRRFFLIAESYGGPGLTILVKRRRNSKGEFATSPESATEKLDTELKQFGRSLHPGARPQPRR